MKMRLEQFTEQSLLTSDVGNCKSMLAYDVVYSIANV